MKKKRLSGTMTRTRRILVFIAAIALLSSCNVTRVISNESQSIQKGDTAIVITTKTIESYNAVKNN